MKEEEINWILNLAKEKKLDLLDTALKEKRLGVFLEFSKIFLNAPISEGGIATEEIEAIRKKYYN